MQGGGREQVWAVGVLAPQKLGWMPWGRWGVHTPLCWGQVAGRVGVAEPVAPGVPMVCGLLWKGGLLLGSLCLSFPRQITITG